MKKAIAWFVENHVATNLVMGFMLLAGIVTAFTMKVEVFPTFALDKVLISVEYEGASPEEIEDSIIKPIEEQIAGVEGIKQIDSTAREGLGTIVVEVEQGWDANKVYDDVRMEVDRVKTLPEDAERPQVQLVTHRSQVIWVAVSGNIGEVALKRLGEKIRDDITNIPGITSAEIFGTRPSEIHIAIPEENLRRYGLSLPQVAKAIRAWGLEIPGGKIHTKGGEVLIRARGRRYYAKNYADIPVKAFPDGRVLRLGQIAHLKEAFADVDIMARYQGMPAVLIQVFRVADQNALTVARKVKDYVAHIRPTLPKGVQIGVYADQSKILKSRLELLVRNMLMGLVLVVVLLGMFLELRLAFWVTLGIPLSFLTAIWLLPNFDVSINMISLFGFILVLGIVVDDAIVIGEHIQTYRERGMDPKTASIEATARMATPVIFSVLTTVAAFAPLLMATGTMGKIMRNLPIVVILVLMASLFEALMLLPSHLSRMRLKPKTKEKRAVRILNRFVEGPYKRALALCLRWRYATIAAGIGLLLLSVGTYTGGWLKFRLFPTVESDVMVASVEMPPGTPVDQTVRVIARLEKAARKAMAKAYKQYQPPDSPPLIKNIVSLVGVMATRRHAVLVGPPATGGHLGQIYVELLGGEHRRVSTTTLVNMWRKEVGVIPGVKRLTFSGEIFSPGYPIEVHLSAPNEAELKAAANELKAYLSHIQGVFDINDSFTPGKWEVSFTLKPKAAALGLTLADVAAQVRGAFLGTEALRLQRGKDEVKVRAILPAKARTYRETLSRLMLTLPGGGQVPFEEVAQVKMRRGYTTIERSQRRRVIKVTADVDPKAANAKNSPAASCLCWPATTPTCAGPWRARPRNSANRSGMCSWAS